MAKPLAKEPIAIIGSACRFAGGVNSPSKVRLTGYSLWLQFLYLMSNKENDKREN
jgi:hypothetical protein